MEEKLSGIILSKTDFKENDRILNIFTLEKGIISAKIKGVKKAGAKLKFASEPFCFAEFILLKKGDFYTVINASLIDSFYSIREDIVKYYAGGSILEFVKKFEKENIVSHKLFLLTVDSLKEITYGEEHPKSVLTEFLIQGLKLIGYGLNIKNCSKCLKEIHDKVFFDYATGGFYCKDCVPKFAREINISTYKSLIKCVLGEKLSKEEADFTLKLLDYYLCNKTEEKLNSLKELIRL